MKQLLSFFCAVLVAITALGQTSPSNKLRSNDSFTQVDNYLVAAKRLGIPSGPSLTLDGSTSSADAPKLFWRTSDSTLHVYVPALSSWLPAGGGQEGGGTWGTITGTLSDQTDLQDALDSKLDTAAHGFGLGWNNTTQEMEWGTSNEIAPGVLLREVDLPDGDIFSIGTPFLDPGPKIHISKATGSLQETAITAGPVGTGVTIGAALDPNNSNLTANFLVGGNGLRLTNSGPVNYTTDRSSSYTARSVVDKEYVDNSISAINVWSKSGTGYKLTDFAAPLVNQGPGSILMGPIPDSSGTLGQYSISAGYNSLARGNRSTSIGFANSIGTTGLYATAIGRGSYVNNPNSVSIGSNNVVTSGSTGQAITIGVLNTSFGSNITTIGQNLIAATTGANQSILEGGITLGRLNNPSEQIKPGTANSKPVLAFGYGTTEASRSTIFQIFPDGTIVGKLRFETTTAGSGYVLKSPDGTRWEITVDNSGNLTTTAL